MSSLSRYFKHGPTSEMPLTGGLLDRRAICPIQVDHVLGPPIFRMDLGIGGPNFTVSGWRSKPHLIVIKVCFRFLVCCYVWRPQLLK